jgi:hypothetical protein
VGSGRAIIQVREEKVMHESAHKSYYVALVLVWLKFSVECLPIKYNASIEPFVAHLLQELNTDLRDGSFVLSAVVLLRRLAEFSTGAIFVFIVFATVSFARSSSDFGQEE